MSSGPYTSEKGCKIGLDRVAAALEVCRYLSHRLGCHLISISQIIPGVKSATAILIDGDIWGFYTPSTISTEAVKALAAKSLPHYGVPTKYICLDNFPETA